jgi:hypothetical protein
VTHAGSVPAVVPSTLSPHADAVVGALVVGRTGAGDPIEGAAALVAYGADAVELDATTMPDAAAAVAAIRARLDTPVAVVTADGLVARAVVDAGAWAVVAPAPCGSPEFLAAVAGASLVVPTVDAARRAIAAGLGARRVLLDVGPGPVHREHLAAGYPLVLTLAGGEGPAAPAAGIAAGCRIVRTPDVRVVRRVADVLAAIANERASERAGAS